MVFKVEENNMSMNMLVTVMMLQMKGENIIKCLNIWKTDIIFVKRFTRPQFWAAKIYAKKGEFAIK